MPKIDKRIIMVILTAAILFIAVITAWVLFSVQKEEPSAEENEEEKITQDLLEELTPKDAEPSNQEELDDLLEELTPSEPKAVAEEEQNETENLLKELTP
ncbi:MAG TPA: hypothetical protein VMW21_02930 [Patescibacteria group bacterium]|nr:hypothetical protein [Patescibacteria group bacterium]